MKRHVVAGLLLLSLASWLTSCAQSDFGTTTSSTETTSAAPVPGEKTGDSAVEPNAGPGTAGANVRW